MEHCQLFSLSVLKLNIEGLTQPSKPSSVSQFLSALYFPSAVLLYQTLNSTTSTSTTEHRELVDDFHGSAVPSEEEPLVHSEEFKLK